MRRLAVVLGVASIGLARTGHTAGTTTGGTTTTGSTGFIGVPNAAVLHPGLFVVSGEAATGWRRGFWQGAGPISVTTGLQGRLELTLSLRGSGLARDQRKDSGTTRAGCKIGISEGTQTSPAMALELYGDHLASTPVPGARLILSSWESEGVWVGVSGGYHGNRLRRRHGPDLGAAIAYRARSDLQYLADVQVEGTGIWGVLFSVAARYQLFNQLELTGGVRWGPVGSAGLQGFLAFSVRSERERPSRRPGDAAVDAAPTGPRFTTDRPRFRMRVPLFRMPGERIYRPLQPEWTPDAGALDLERRPPPPEIGETGAETNPETPQPGDSLEEPESGDTGGSSASEEPVPEAGGGPR